MTLKKITDFIRGVVDHKICDAQDLFLIKGKIDEFEMSTCPDPENCPVENASEDVICPRCELDESVSGLDSGENDNTDPRQCPQPSICPNDESFNYCPECGKENSY
jgi:hypothetical protein